MISDNYQLWKHSHSNSVKFFLVLTSMLTEETSLTDRPCSITGAPKLISAEQFIENIYDRQVHEINIIPIKMYDEIVKRISNFDMLFKLANDGLMLVMMSLPENIVMTSLTSDERFVRIGTKNYVLCSMNSDSSGFEVLSPYNNYEYTEGKYFDQTIKEEDIEDNDMNRDKIIEFTKRRTTNEMLFRDIIEQYPGYYHYYLSELQKNRSRKIPSGWRRR